MLNDVTDAWIDSCIADGDEKWLYLKNGIRLIGTLLRQDNQGIVMRSDHTETLVYKDTVATIVRTPDR